MGKSFLFFSSIKTGNLINHLDFVLALKIWNYLPLVLVLLTWQGKAMAPARRHGPHPLPKQSVMETNETK